MFFVWMSDSVQLHVYRALQVATALTLIDRAFDRVVSHAYDGIGMIIQWCVARQRAGK